MGAGGVGVGVGVQAAVNTRCVASNCSRSKLPFSIGIRKGSACSFDTFSAYGKVTTGWRRASPCDSFDTDGDAGAAAAAAAVGGGELGTT